MLIVGDFNAQVSDIKLDTEPEKFSKGAYMF